MTLKTFSSAVFDHHQKGGAMQQASLHGLRRSHWRPTIARSFSRHPQTRAVAFASCQLMAHSKHSSSDCWMSSSLGAVQCCLQCPACRHPPASYASSSYVEQLAGLGPSRWIHSLQAARVGQRQRWHQARSHSCPRHHERSPFVPFVLPLPTSFCRHRLRDTLPALSRAVLALCP
jgi:hypothetical protein